jgi:TfoX/Sxy family transcriptional regulator of competence genes
MVGVQMPKATDADKDRFRSLVPEQPAVEVKPMFGQLGAFVNGNMFAGLFGDGIGVKVDDAARAELEAMGGPFGPQERPMPGYLTLPPSLAEADAADWVERARAHVAQLPPKVKKPKAPKKG